MVDDFISMPLRYSFTGVVICVLSFGIPGFCKLFPAVLSLSIKQGFDTWGTMSWIFQDWICKSHLAVCGVGVDAAEGAGLSSDSWHF